MAITVQQYDHTCFLHLNKALDFTKYTVMLLGAGATFTSTHTTVDAVAGAASPHRANELYGNAWPEGGVAITGLAATQVALGGDGKNNDAMLTGANVVVTASGGPLPPTPASGELIFESATMKPLWFVNYGQLEQAGDTTDYKSRWNAAGGIFNIQAA